MTLVKNLWEKWSRNPTFEKAKIGPEPNLTAHMCIHIYMYMFIYKVLTWSRKEPGENIGS